MAANAAKSVLAWLTMTSTRRRLDMGPAKTPLLRTTSGRVVDEDQWGRLLPSRPGVSLNGPIDLHKTASCLRHARRGFDHGHARSQRPERPGARGPVRWGHRQLPAGLLLELRLWGRQVQLRPRRGSALQLAGLFIARHEEHPRDPGQDAAERHLLVARAGGRLR